jgi:hypothetical protein
MNESVQRFHLGSLSIKPLTVLSSNDHGICPILTWIDHTGFSIERYSIRPERQKHVHHTLSFCIAHFHRSNTCRHKMVSSRRKQAVGSFFAKSYLPTRHKHPSVRQMFSQNLHYSQLYTRTPREVHARFARRQVTWSQNT